MIRRRHAPTAESSSTAEESKTANKRKDAATGGKTMKQPGRRTVLPALSFLLLLIVRIVGALVNPIGDCDETFNYWEPLHFLLYKFGFQTWEYSPKFALRSYAYLYPYGVVAWFTKIIQTSFPLISSTPPKILQFYTVRIVQATLSAVTELFLVRSVYDYLSSEISALLFISLLFSPGILRAAPEFLPSSFAMICITASYAAWIRRAYFPAVFFVALASLLGWIYIVVLGVPIALDIIFYHERGLILFITHAALSGIPVILAMIAIDSWHYQKLILAPLNHILYNIFPTPETGSQLYGTEPWTYYVINLFLNAPAVAPLFFIYPAVLVVVALLKSPSIVQHRVKTIIGIFMTFAIFMAQPHKEERFLAPMYPLISLVACFCLYDALSIFSSRTLNKIAFIGFGIANVLLGTSRSVMQVWSFRAPLSQYAILNGKLQDEHTSKPHASWNVCVGDEWYRFPGNMFMPEEDTATIRFIRAGFDGALPIPYTENGTSGGAEELNELNQAVDRQFFDGICHYWITMINQAQDVRDIEEKDLPKGITHPFIISREPFLNSASSPSGIRAFYFPPLHHRLAWSEYVIVRNESFSSS